MLTWSTTQELYKHTNLGRGKLTEQGIKWSGVKVWVLYDLPKTPNT